MHDSFALLCPPAVHRSSSVLSCVSRPSARIADTLVHHLSRGSRLMEGKSILIELVFDLQGTVLGQQCHGPVYRGRRALFHTTTCVVERVARAVESCIG